MADAPAGGFFQAQWEAMSPRDRRLLAGLGIFFVVVVGGIFLFTARGWVADKRSRVETARQNLALLQAMADEHTLAQKRIEGAEERMKGFGGQSPSAYLEKVATEKSVREVFTVTQQGTESEDGLRRTELRVELKKAALTDAIQFVGALETGGYPLTIDLARYKAVAGPATPEGPGPKLIDLTLEIAAWQTEAE